MILDDELRPRPELDDGTRWRDPAERPAASPASPPRWVLVMLGALYLRPAPADDVNS